MSLLDRTPKGTLTTFDEIVDAIIEHEGGNKYTHDPKDPGGGTRFGISKNRYPRENIKKLTRERAIELYKKDYWDRYAVERMPKKFRYIYMDMVVNMGPGRAKRAMQRGANGTVDPPLVIDGRLGPKTMRALKHRKVDIGKIRAARIFYYCTLVARKPELMRFLEGWIARALEV